MRVLSFLLIFSLGLAVVFAQQEAAVSEQDEKTANDQLNQKIKMVDYMLHSPAMLQRMESSDDKLAKDLLARAAENFLNMEEYFDRGQFLEAEAIIDYVLRDLSAASQLLSISHQKRNKYQKSLEQLDSFVFPAWKDLSIVENEYLQKTLQQISEMRNQAISHSQSGELDQAVKLLEEAQQLKVTLIEKLKHISTVVYDLKFDSINDEYSYLNNRTYHYLELVDIALAKKDIDLQTRNLVDNYIQQSMVNLESAETLESEGKISDAIAVLDKSIKQLTSVLKLLGIKI
jgi:hypothetical protein